MNRHRTKLRSSRQRRGFIDGGWRQKERAVLLRQSADKPAVAQFGRWERGIPMPHLPKKRHWYAALQVLAQFHTSSLAEIFRGNCAAKVCQQSGAVELRAPKQYA